MIHIQYLKNNTLGGGKTGIRFRLVFILFYFIYLFQKYVKLALNLTSHSTVIFETVDAILLFDSWYCVRRGNLESGKLHCSTTENNVEASRKAPEESKLKTFMWHINKKWLQLHTNGMTDVGERGAQRVQVTSASLPLKFRSVIH